jgi:predicted helicase
MLLFEPTATYEPKRPNLTAELVDRITKVFRKAFSSEQIFFYIYAVLYSEIYRAKYAEFLKIDFPRVPFTKDYKLFKKMCEYGHRIVDLHLLKSAEVDSPVARFQGKAGNKVEKVKYLKGKVYINNDQYFEGISTEVWEYQIGAYQVCDKWLKERKGRILSLDGIKHYCNVVTALTKTIEIQKEIDNLYPAIEKEIIEFKVE